MLKSVCGLLVAFWMTMTFASARCRGQDHGLQCRTMDNHVQMTADGKSIGQFVFRDAKVRRPYFTNLKLPEGEQVTRNHPPRAGVDAMDHDTMHPGVWLAFGDLSGVDFWRNKGSIEHVRFMEEPRVEQGKVAFQTECQFVNEQGQAIGTLRNRLGVWLYPQNKTSDENKSLNTSGWVLSWDATIVADRQALILGDQEEMGFGARVATPLTEKNGGRILNSRGLISAAKSWGQPAEWCDYAGTIDGKPMGLALFASPQNRYPSWWHNRDYGLMVANPFGRKAMKQGEKSQIKIEQGDSLSLRFGAYVHRGQSDNYEDVLSSWTRNRD